jgi:hypothetical protein
MYFVEGSVGACIGDGQASWVSEELLFVSGWGFGDGVDCWEDCVGKIRPQVVVGEVVHGGQRQEVVLRSAGRCLIQFLVAQAACQIQGRSKSAPCTSDKGGAYFEPIGCRPLPFHRPI